MIFRAHLLHEICFTNRVKKGENRNFKTWSIYLFKSFNLAHNVLNPIYSPKNMELTYISNKYHITHD